MHKFLVLWKAYIQSVAQYRGNMLVYILSNSIVPFTSLAVWLSVSNSSTNLPLTQPELIWYFLLIAFQSNWISAWHSYYLNQEINDGSFVKYLIKPYSIISDIFAANLGDKFFKMPLIIIGVMVIALLANLLQYGVIKFDLYLVTLFIISASMSLVITLLQEIIIGLLAFWVYDNTFINNYIGMVEDVFSGKVIPISFLPQYLLVASTWLPFRYVVGFPVEVLLNKLPPNELALGFGIQIGWLLIYCILFKLVFTKATKKFQGYGI